MEHAPLTKWDVLRELAKATLGMDVTQFIPPQSKESIPLYQELVDDKLAMNHGSGYRATAVGIQHMYGRMTPDVLAKYKRADKLHGAK